MPYTFPTLESKYSANSIVQGSITISHFPPGSAAQRSRPSTLRPGSEAKTPGFEAQNLVIEIEGGRDGWMDERMDGGGENSSYVNAKVPYFLHT